MSAEEHPLTAAIATVTSDEADIPKPGTLQHLAYMIGLHWDEGECIDHLWADAPEETPEDAEEDEEDEDDLFDSSWPWRVWSPPWIEDDGSMITLEVTDNYPDTDDPAIALKPETEMHVYYFLKDGKIVDEKWFR